MMQELTQKKLTNGVEVHLSETDKLENLRPDQALNLAKKHIKQGNYDKAGKIYEAILTEF